MKNTPVFGIPYLEPSDLLSQFPTQSKQLSEGIESVMLSGQFRGPEGQDGPQGPPGLPGLDAVPADEGIAAYVSAPSSATRQALGEVFTDPLVATWVNQLSSATRQALGEAFAPLLPSTDWENVEITASGWAHANGAPAQVRLRNGRIEGRGYLTNATFTGGFTAVAKLPASIPAPPAALNSEFPLPSNTAVARSGRVTTAKTLDLYAAAASSAWWSLSMLAAKLI